MTARELAKATFNVNGLVVSEVTLDQVVELMKGTFEAGVFSKQKSEVKATRYKLFLTKRR